MTVFGDLDVSTIRTMPVGRAGIETFVAPVGEKPGWFERVWQRAAEEVGKGHQVFVVCPAIDVEATGKAATDDTVEAPPVEGENARVRWGVVQVERMLAARADFADLRVSILHGRMPGDEKDATMRAFADGQIDVLIATTVIEVGVDVPNASTMVILEADRFGVSQLHQLRGRVGRGGVPGLCLLVTEAPYGTPARSRVEAVAGTLDGFELAEVDLELRGRGRRAGRHPIGCSLVAAAAARCDGCSAHRRSARRSRGDSARRSGPQRAHGPRSCHRSSSGRRGPRGDGPQLTERRVEKRRPT